MKTFLMAIKPNAGISPTIWFHKLMLLTIFLMLTAITSYTQNNTCYTTLSPKEFRMCMDSSMNKIIIDVRPFKELNNKKITGAKLAPSKAYIDRIIDSIDVETPILVYCVIGIRSEKVCEMLCKQGFTKVVGLKGGFDRWKKKGFETIDIKN